MASTRVLSCRPLLDWWDQAEPAFHFQAMMGRFQSPYLGDTNPHVPANVKVWNCPSRPQSRARSRLAFKCCQRRCCSTEPHSAADELSPASPPELEPRSHPSSQCG